MTDEWLNEVLAQGDKMECNCEYGPLDDSGNPHLPGCKRDSLRWDIRRLVHEFRVLRAKNRVLEAERDLARVEGDVRGRILV